MTYKQLIKEVEEIINFSTPGTIGSDHSITIQFSGVEAEIQTSGEVVFTHSRDNKTENHKLENIKNLDEMDSMAITFYLSK